MCFPCNSGLYSPAGASECTACASGEADHDADGSTPCITCNPGTFSRVQGQSCRDCDAGYYDDDHADTAAGGAKTECQVCPSGTYSAGSDDAAFTGTNPEVYALACTTCPDGQADLDGDKDGQAGGYCATGSTEDPHNPGDYVDRQTQQQCHGTCSLTLEMPTHDQTEVECLALGSCDSTLLSGEVAATQAECEGIRPVPGVWTSAGGVWTPAPVIDGVGGEGFRWHSPYCAKEDGDWVDITVEADCHATSAGSQPPGYFWHPEVFYSASTPCVSCVPGKYQVAGQITCLQCDPGSTTDTLAASGASSCTPITPGFFDHDSAFDGTTPYCRGPETTAGANDGAYVTSTTENACTQTGNTWDAGSSTCTSGADGSTIAGVVDEDGCLLTGNTWQVDEVFYSSTTAPEECNDGYTTDTAAGASATACFAAPAGTYDHDQLSTTVPLTCPGGYTTNTLTDPGATVCTAAAIGWYDHDGSSTTDPLECGDGYTTSCDTSRGFVGDPEAVEACSEIATPSVQVDADNCAAVTLGTANSAADCAAIRTDADNTVQACVYTSGDPLSCTGGWSVGDAAATGCDAVGQNYYDHDKDSSTAALSCAGGNMVGECIQAECRDANGALLDGIVTQGGDTAASNAAACAANDATNVFTESAVTLCATTSYYRATTCTPVPAGTYDHDSRSITLPEACPAGSTTDTLAAGGASSCTEAPPGFYDDDSGIDGAPFCADSSGNFLSADPAAVRPSSMYCEVAGIEIRLVNPTDSDVSANSVQIESAAGLANPTAAFVGNYAQQSAQTNPFTLADEDAYESYFSFMFYETANLYKLMGGSETFSPDSTNVIGPLYASGEDVICSYTDTDSVVTTMDTFYRTQSEVDCVGVPGQTWSRHETFYSSTTAPVECPAGSTTNSESAAGATLCTEAPAGRFDHDSECHGVYAYCRDSFNVCVDVTTAEFCEGAGFTWHQADFCLDADGVTLQPSAADATACSNLDPAGTWEPPGCYDGGTQKSSAEICAARTGHTWMATDTFYSSTTSPTECLDGSTTYKGTPVSPVLAGVGTGATMCIAAPPGEYDDDGLATTAPLQCPQGYTTDTRTVPGAVACTAAPIGFYDHDRDASTIPVVCNAGFTTYLPNGDAAIIAEGATDCVAAVPGFYDHDSAYHDTTQHGGSTGYCSESDGTLTTQVDEETCENTAATCTGDGTCASDFAAQAPDTSAGACAGGCTYAPSVASGRTWHDASPFYSSTTPPVECAAGSTTNSAQQAGGTTCTAVPAGEYDHDSGDHGLTPFCMSIEGQLDASATDQAACISGTGRCENPSSEVVTTVEQTDGSFVTAVDQATCEDWAAGTGYTWLDASAGSCTTWDAYADFTLTGCVTGDACATHSSRAFAEAACVNAGTDCGGIVALQSGDWEIRASTGPTSSTGDTAYVKGSSSWVGTESECEALGNTWGDPTGFNIPTNNACIGCTDRCVDANGQPASEGAYLDVHVTEATCISLSGRTLHTWVAPTWSATGTFYSSMTPPIDCPDGSTTDTLTNTGAVSCDLAPPGMFDDDGLSTTPPLECGHGAPVVCYQAGGGVVPCTELLCTRTGNSWAAGTCTTTAGVVTGAASCTGTANDIVQTPDCAAAFAGAGDTLPASCPAGCTYTEAFTQTGCLYTGHVWDEETDRCSDVSGRGYCEDGDGNRLLATLASHDWHDPDLCEGTTGRTWIWNQFRGYETNTLAAGGATNCYLCDPGKADTDRTSTTACAICDPGETTLRCTAPNGDAVAAIDEAACDAASNTWDTQTSTCTDSGGAVVSVATEALCVNNWGTTGSTSCALCNAGDYDDDDNAATDCVECGDGSTVYTLDGDNNPTVLAATGGATRCIAAPPGEYDDDGVSTTAPLECGDGSVDDDSATAGYTTNTLASAGATACVAAPPGTYDHDSMSTTAPQECGDGDTADNSNVAGFATDALAHCLSDDGVNDVRVQLSDSSYVPGISSGNTWDAVGQECTDGSGNVISAVGTEAACVVTTIYSQAACEIQATGNIWTGCADSGNAVIAAADQAACEQTGNTWSGSVCSDVNGNVMVATCTGTADDGVTDCAANFGDGTTEADCNAAGTAGQGCTFTAPPSDSNACTQTGNTWSTVSCYDSDGNEVTGLATESDCITESTGNTWTLRSGATSCTACPQGRADIDRLSITDCEPCAFGTTTVNPSSGVFIGATQCFGCPDGSYDHDNTATTPCFTCDAGKFGQGTAIPCAECAEGKYDDDRLSSTPCVDCLSGQHSEPGQTFCSDCPKGEQDHDSDPSTPCIDCGEGTFSPQRSTSCINCEAGYADTDEAASTECEMCQPGQYSAAQATSCTTCEAGQTDADGQGTQDLYDSQVSVLLTLDASVTQQCRTNWVTGTCTRASGNSWNSNLADPCTNDETGAAVVAAGEDDCELTAVPINDRVGCIAEAGTWNVLQFCAPTQDGVRDESSTDELSCETDPTTHEWRPDRCMDGTTAYPSATDQATCEIESTGNTWDTGATFDCTDANNAEVTASDEATCTTQATGRTWTLAACFSDAGAALPAFTDEADCTTDASGNTWFPGICKKNDMLTTVTQVVNNQLVDVLDQTVCTQAQTECWAITDRWDRVGAYLEERIESCVSADPNVAYSVAFCANVQLDQVLDDPDTFADYMAENQNACNAASDQITANIAGGVAGAAGSCVYTQGAAPSASTPCEACANGRYTDRLFFGECTPCAAGKFDEDENPATPCEDCLAGRYTPADQTTCTNCVAGKYDNDLNPATVCLDCIAGYYSAPITSYACFTAQGAVWDISSIDNPVEADCINDARPDNNFVVTTTGSYGSLGCIGCDFGKADEDNDASTPCTDCRFGQYAPQLASTCTDCSEGFGDDDLDPATPCVQCRVGMFAPAGATNCTGCPPGKHDGDMESTTACEDCLAGQYSGSGWTNCTNCTAGFADEDQDPSTPCDACSPGQYVPEFSIVCVDCLSFEYDNDSNPATPCVLCDEGHHTNGLACISCLPGTFDDDADPATECENCMIGQFSTIEAVSCTDCAAGSQDHDQNPATPCEPCGAGNYSGLGDLFCFPCRPGTYDNDTDAATPCVSCPSGSFSAVGATECDACASGRIDKDFNPATPCVACPPGSYAGVGATICTTCGAGEIDHDQNPATPCAQCDPGKHSSLQDYKCDICSTGLYDDDRDPSTPCVDCEGGQYTSGAGRCTAGSTEVFGYSQWSSPIPQTEAACTIRDTTNVWYTAARCLDTDGVTTLAAVTSQNDCENVPGRTWASGCFASDGSVQMVCAGAEGVLPGLDQSACEQAGASWVAPSTSDQCLKEPTGYSWVRADPWLCSAYEGGGMSGIYTDCSAETTDDVGVTEACFAAVSASAYTPPCQCTPAVTDGASVCAECEAKVLADMAWAPNYCTSAGQVGQTVCVIPSRTDLGSCEIKSSANDWTLPVCTSPATAFSWRDAGTGIACYDSSDALQSATDQPTCEGNAAVDATDETDCEIESTGRTWIDGWCNDYARCVDGDGDEVTTVTDATACEVASTGNTWDPVARLESVNSIDVTADTVTLAYV